MSTTIVDSTLKVTIAEQISLNGQTFTGLNTLTVTSINEYDKRIMTVLSASEVTLAAFGTAVAAGQYIRANVKYLRITNKDSANFIRIRMKKTGADTYDVKLGAGESFLLHNGSYSVAATAGAFSAFQNLDSISAQADTADVDIELAVASV